MEEVGERHVYYTTSIYDQNYCIKKTFFYTVFICPREFTAIEWLDCNEWANLSAVNQTILALSEYNFPTFTRTKVKSNYCDDFEMRKNQNKNQNPSFLYGRLVGVCTDEWKTKWPCAETSNRNVPLRTTAVVISCPNQAKLHPVWKLTRLRRKKNEFFTRTFVRYFRFHFSAFSRSLHIFEKHVHPDNYYRETSRQPSSFFHLQRETTTVPLGSFYTK